MPLIALLFLTVPIIELIVIVYAAQSIGTPQTLLALLVVSIVGAWLVKVEGVGVWRRFSATISRGEVPHREIVDGVLILCAGAFMLTPGFVTDAVGLAFLAPPTRAVIRALVLKRMTAGLVVGVPRGFAGGTADARPGGDVWDTTGWESGPSGTGGSGTHGPDDPPDPPRSLDR